MHSEALLSAKILTMRRYQWAVYFTCIRFAELFTEAFAYIIAEIAIILEIAITSQNAIDMSK